MPEYKQNVTNHCGNSVVFTVEATVDQCLAVGTTYTYQIIIYLLSLIIVHFNFDNVTQFVQHISSFGKGKEEKAEG